MILAENASGLSLNGQPIPGIFESLSVGSKLLSDAKAVEGGSGKQYQINGFDDAAVTFALRLIDGAETKEAALGKIITLFKRFNESGEPVIYQLDFSQAREWNLQGCLFLSLDSSQSGGKQEIKVNLKFAEYRPEAARMQEQAQDKQAAAEVPDPPISPVFTEQEEIDIRLERTR